MIGRYFAPEYCMHGIVDEKTDVYSYGVLLLEIITGRPALDDLKQSVVIWVNHFPEIVIYYIISSNVSLHERPQKSVIFHLSGKTFACC